jgi:serine protease Do
VFLVFTISSCQNCSRSGRKAAREELAKKNSVKTPIEKSNKAIQPEKNIDVKKTPKPSKSVAEMFTELEQGVVMVYSFQDNGSYIQGSGFMIHESGIGITNYHVLKGNKNSIIKTAEGIEYRIIKILEKSAPEKLDYAIFKVDNKGHTFKYLSIATQETKIGEDVFVIGSPRGLENSLTKGSISQYRENNRIQFDAAVYFGSSGGPLFNMNGEIIGITTSIIEGAALNFAINIQAIPYQKYVKKK